MGKKILKLLLYLMAVVGVLIWLDSTEGLTEEGALIIFGIALLMYFVMKLIGFLTKRHRIRRERARKARRKRELREVNNYRVKQETSVAATAASQANHRKQQKIHNQSGHKFHMTRKKIVWTVGLLATFCIVVLAGKTWIRQHEQIHLLRLRLVDPRANLLCIVHRVRHRDRYGSRRNSDKTVLHMLRHPFCELS